MCRRVDCKKCGKPSWAGCGAHVEQVLGNIPAADRCHCREDRAKSHEAGSSQDERSWISRLFSRQDPGRDAR